MATVVDALLVTLGMDTKDYEKGEKKAEDLLEQLEKKDEELKKKQLKATSQQEKKKIELQRKSVKEQIAAEKKRRETEQKEGQEREKRNKDTSEALKKIRNQLVAIGGLFMAGQGIMGFVKQQVDLAANVGRLSENTGLAVEDLAGLQQAFTRTGGSAEDAQATIAMLTKNLANMRSGMESNVSEFMRWGGSTNQGQFKNTREYILGIADLLQRVNKTDPGKAWNIASRLGLSDAAFNLLKQGRGAVQAQIADGAKLAAMNKKQADEAREAQRAWADMSTLLASVGRAVLFPILRAIQDWTKGHQGNIQVWITQIRDFLSKATPEAIAKIGDQFTKIANAIDKIGDAAVKLAPLMDKLGLSKTTDAEFRAQKAQETQRVVKYFNDRKIAREQAAAVAGNTDNSVHVGQMTINTKATDAKGVAAGMHDALQYRGMTTQSGGTGG